MYPSDIKMRLLDAQQSELKKISAELNAQKEQLTADQWAVAWQCVIDEIDRVDLEYARLGASDDGEIDDRDSWGNTLGESPANG